MSDLPKWPHPSNWSPGHLAKLREYGIHWGPLPIVDLRVACDKAGLVGDDQDAALRAYIERGTISTGDREWMDAADDHERSTYAVRRWGMDGVRVGLIAYRERIGGLL